MRNSLHPRPAGEGRGRCNSVWQSERPHDLQLLGRCPGPWAPALEFGGDVPRARSPGHLHLERTQGPTNPMRSLRPILSCFSHSGVPPTKKQRAQGEPRCPHNIPPKPGPNARPSPATQRRRQTEEDRRAAGQREPCQTRPRKLQGYSGGNPTDP